jgi:hypothetical protein
MLKQNFQLFIICTLALYCLVSTHDEYDDLINPEDIALEVEQKQIYYGSAVRFRHIRSGFHLHSHDLRYGTGSGQQSVTGMRADNDYNSLWQIKEAQDEPIKLYTELVKCGDTIRLEHSLTHKNLHSHDFRSPVSGRFEVTGYGNEGNGDSADNWRIVCQDQSADSILTGRSIFAIEHAETRRFLFADPGLQFDHRNCGQNCPILGQIEISCDDRNTAFTKWKIVSGVFFLAGEGGDDYDSDDYQGYSDL